MGVEHGLDAAAFGERLFEASADGRLGVLSAQVALHEPRQALRRSHVTPSNAGRPYERRRAVVVAVVVRGRRRFGALVVGDSADADADVIRAAAAADAAPSNDPLANDPPPAAAAAATVAGPLLKPAAWGMRGYGNDTTSSTNSRKSRGRSLRYLHASSGRPHGTAPLAASKATGEKPSSLPVSPPPVRSRVALAAALSFLRVGGPHGRRAVHLRQRNAQAAHAHPQSTCGFWSCCSVSPNEAAPGGSAPLASVQYHA
jgi:hypothetical protein